MNTFCIWKLLFLKILIIGVDNSHIAGTWNTQEDFLLIKKFGFQKSNIHDQSNSGFIYGNISIKHVELNNYYITFVLLNQDAFRQFYHTIQNQMQYKSKDEYCEQIFSNNLLNNCKGGSNTDCTNFVTCKEAECYISNASYNFIPGSKFAYRVEEFQNPKYWYASIVSCYLNSTSYTWHHIQQSLIVHYDIWFVNGNPNRSTFNPFVYQFSYETQNSLEFYLLFFVVYALLIPVQIYAASHQTHPVTKLFTGSLLLEFFGISLNLLDSSKYAVDGVGYQKIGVIGDILDIMSRTTFMLLLLLLAKGWAVTRIQFSWNPFICVIWLIYGFVHILLYTWTKIEIDIIEEIDEYQTWPGYLILLLRLVIIIWFLLELRNTMKYEHNQKKLNFFLHFGASALVWFIYLPIIAIVSVYISSLWRYKLLLGIIYGADCLAYCIMTHLLWPTRSEQYFLLATTFDSGNEDLEVYNESPHILNSHTNPCSKSQISSEGVKLIDLDVYA